MEYRKKSVVVNAWEWLGEYNPEERPEWLAEALADGTVTIKNPGESNTQMIIKTLEGDHTANPHDYIIQGVAGELYPCKPEIFNATYEIVNLDDDDVPLETLMANPGASDTVPEKVKIKADTIIRTIVLALALINQILAAAGYNPLPIEDATVYELGSLLLTLGASLWAWWKNNSFTRKAIEADEELHGKIY